MSSPSRPVHSRSKPRPSLFALAGLAAIVLAAGLVACDRNIEDYDPNETARQPDLSRIFPAPEEAMQQGAGQMAAGQAAAVRGNLPPSRTEAGGSPASAAGGGETIRGQIVTSPAFAGEGGSHVLFLIARPYGAAGGPPMAVLRVPAPSLPMDFEIGPANVMIPSMKFAGQIQLEARLDGDGNATTRQPGDLVANVVGPLEPGASGVEIVLNQKL